MSFFKRVISSLSNSIQRGNYGQRIKTTISRIFYINLDVGKLQFPEKNRYRYPAPASREAPDFSLNFPVKSETLSNQRYAEREPRLFRESEEPNAVEYGTANPDLSKTQWVKPGSLPDDPRLDPRNLWLFRDAMKDITLLATEESLRPIQHNISTLTSIEHSNSLRPGLPGYEEEVKRLKEKRKQRIELESRCWSHYLIRKESQARAQSQSQSQSQPQT